MRIPKPSDDVKDFFRTIVPADADVEVKPMFGNLGAFVNGNMFAGLFGDDIGVRLLDDDSIAALEAIPETGPFGPPGRAMSGYVRLPRAWRTTPELVMGWVAVALEQVGRLPAKQPKPRTARKKA